MNKNEAITSLISEAKTLAGQYENTRAFLATLPESLNIYMVDNTHVYVEKATYKENMDTLHEIRKLHDAKLSHYYYSGYCDKDELALMYMVKAADGNEDNKIGLVFYCTDFNNALQHAGNGKCTLVETEVSRPSKSKSIVCDNT